MNHDDNDKVLCMEQFEQLYNEFQNQLRQTPTNDDDDDDEHRDSFHKQCRALLQQMNVEARMVGMQDFALQRQFMNRIQTCRQQYQQWTAETAARQRKLLLAGKGGTGHKNTQNNISDNQSASIEAVTRMAAQQDEMLQRVRQTMQETETTALSITQELQNNRERIQSARGNIHETLSLTHRAKSILQNMSKFW